MEEEAVRKRIGRGRGLRGEKENGRNEELLKSIESPQQTASLHYRHPSFFSVPPPQFISCLLHSRLPGLSKKVPF